jgi:hypothetical protein
MMLSCAYCGSLLVVPLVLSSLSKYFWESAPVGELFLKNIGEAAEGLSKGDVPLLSSCQMLFS